MEALKMEKRKVPARIRLADTCVLQGEIYVDVEHGDGTPGRVADRLNDRTERFMPFATEVAHVLLNKAEVISVELSTSEFDLPSSRAYRELFVELRLCNKTRYEGKIHARLEPGNARVLDYLNASTQNFIAILGDERLTMVNRDYIVGVTEPLNCGAAGFAR